MGDSKANVVAERAVQSAEKMVRVHKLAFDEHELTQDGQSNNPWFAWLVKHVSDIMNRFLVGRDERLVPQEWKGNVANSMSWSLGPPLCFASAERWKELAMSERWCSGF